MVLSKQLSPIGRLAYVLEYMMTSLPDSLGLAVEGLPGHTGGPGSVSLPRVLVHQKEQEFDLAGTVYT